MALSTLKGFVMAALPSGRLLPEDAWNRRHRAILAVLWLHVPILIAVGVFTGHGWAHSAMEAALIAVFATAATTWRGSLNAKASLATIGLISTSAILVHFSGGLIEMHFHFFVMVAIVTLYQAWAPFLLAIGFVVLHHGTVGILDPSAVYNHPSAITNPWKWALIHGLFIAGASAAGLTAWKMNELGIERERDARDELQSANQDLAEAQSMANIGSWDWDLIIDEVWWSEELYRIFGVPRDAFTPSLEAFLACVHLDDQARVQATIEEALATGEDFSFETKIIRPQGTTRMVHALGKAIAGPEGDVIRMAGTVQDISDRKALEEQVEYQAFHDSLTGLANRALFVDRVDHALSRHQRAEGSLAVLFLDLDDFKVINDSLGHGPGDQLLVEVAARIHATLRPADTFARLGGDEFAILLEDLPEDHRATIIAKRIQETLSQPIRLMDKELHVKVSIGIALSDTTTKSTDELVRRADTAMYEAKRRGKGSFAVFREGMAEAAVERLTMRADLQRALNEHEFVLHYQPIIRLDDGAITGVEALVRWMHPERGLMQPLDFIPFAEETGLIVPLTKWVLEEACTTAVGWVGEAGAPITVAVNISTVQFRHPGLEKEIIDTLARTGLAPERLVLEITESVLVQDHEAVTDRLVQLKELGVQLAIDDFGTGYSSLSYLRDFPIDLLKVDKSFIDSIALGAEESALARALIKLGRTLGLKVVAEGVEDRDQSMMLKALKCEYVQGYLFSKPVEPARIDDLLERRPEGSRASTRMAEAS